jgi:tRNA pseudouridine38-40 synthase
VQQVVQDALAVVLRLGSAAPLTVAGRTDAGVHARGQVAHVDVPTGAWSAVTGSLDGRLAGVLPRDVRIWSIVPAPAGFDARFSALSRRYSYRIATHLAGVDPLRRREVVWRPRPLDIERMNDAAGLLLGEHDFAAYCRRREGASTIRRLLSFEWMSGDGLIVVTLEANAFCHNMVRALVGAVVRVGESRCPVDWPARVLAGAVRNPGVQVMPPHGLTLEGVRYPPDTELAARALAARTRPSLADPSAAG